MTTTTTPNYHVITVKYLGATNHKPARYKLISERFKQNIVCSYSAHLAFNDSIEYAINKLQSMGFDIIGKAEGGQQHDYIISNTFKPFTEIK